MNHTFKHFYTLRENLVVAKRGAYKLYGGKTIIGIFVFRVALMLLAWFGGFVIALKLLGRGHPLFVVISISLLLLIFWVDSKWFCPWINRTIMSKTLHIKNRPHETEMKFNDIGINIVAPNFDAVIRWAGIIKVSDSKEHVLFFVGFLIYFIPHVCFDTSEARREFIADCDAKIKLARDQNEETN